VVAHLIPVTDPEGVPEALTETVPIHLTPAGVFLEIRRQQQHGNAVAAAEPG